MQLVVKLGGATLWVPACRASKDEKLLLAAGGDGSAPARPRRRRGGDEGPAAEGRAEDVQIGEVGAVSAEAARMCARLVALLFTLTARPKCLKCLVARRMLAEGLQVLSSLLAGGAPERLNLNQCLE